MRHLYILVFVLLCGLRSTGAEPPETVFAEARAAYDARDYAKAAEMLETIRRSEGSSPQLYLDLGNTYFMASDYGRCVASYLRGLKLSPRDTQLRSNLEFVLSKVDDRNTAALKGKPGSVVPDTPSFFESAGNSITRNVHPDTWAWLAIGVFLGSICGACLYLFVRSVIVRKIGFFSFFILLGFAVFLNIFAFSARSAYNSSQTCVLISYQGELHVEPAEKSPQTGITLSAGTVLDILQSESQDGGTDWLKVRLNSENTGWIEASHVEII